MPEIKIKMIEMAIGYSVGMLTGYLIFRRSVIDIHADLKEYLERLVYNICGSDTGEEEILVKVNIRDIIRNAGYEILSENIRESDNNLTLKLRFKAERIEAMRARIVKTGGYYDYDLTGEFEVCVGEVGCDGEGVVYVVLNEITRLGLPCEVWDIVGFEDDF